MHVYIPCFTKKCTKEQKIALSTPDYCILWLREENLSRTLNNSNITIDKKKSSQKYVCS